MHIQIITDSACDLPKERLEALEVKVLPLYVTCGEQIYRDGIDIQPEEIYANMKKGVVYKTSQIPYQDYYDCFKTYAEAGKPALLLSFSSGLSGTYQTACLACKDIREDYPEADIQVVDTKAVTGGLGMIVNVVAEQAQRGMSMQDLIQLTKHCSAHIHHIFTVTNLEYVCRGGRLNRPSALIGNALKIHPFMIVDREGKLEITDKCRGEKRLVKKFVDYIAAHSYDISNQKIYFVDAYQDHLVEAIQNQLTARYGNTNFSRKLLAPVIGTHIGPGSMTVFFFDEAPL
ncbi:DegV family protein [Pseudoramibacter sp.]|jgi:DegV family protein with EDD domain|uniref:DegV family protein n=1 Tax=Pseudoramibacter sp. TaxID=2034862 RepID=UPI0025F39F98|nr:DegV family protein [Pseudoramibacter sp.]MCH4072980.1 DegV family protein [Pseudoramibacter sp.]MCH4106751.1 DegV family protein [Pseudoramibacter sp.]